MKYLLTCILGIMLLSSIHLDFYKDFTRDVSITLPECIVNKVISDTENMTYDEIAEYCCNLTNSLVDYSLTVKLTDTLENSQGHCVTYSTICKEMCNIAYKTHNISAKAYVSVGHIKCVGIDLHSLFKAITPTKYHRFFINHDVVEVVYNGQSRLYDPSLTDITKQQITYNLMTKSTH